MRLDESLGDQQIRLCGDRVDDDPTAGGEFTDLDEKRLVVAVVNVDVLVVDDLVPALAPQLLGSGSAVTPVSMRMVILASGLPARISSNISGVMTREGTGRV